LLPFHRLGSAKYEAMGLEYAYKTQQPLTKEELGKIEAIYKTYFSVKIEG
jgi:pyruvate-formate lyase-activating enzyme